MAKPSLSPLEEMVKENCFQRGIISEFYHLLTSYSPEKLKIKLNTWKEDFQLYIFDAHWKGVCNKVHTKCINTLIVCVFLFIVIQLLYTEFYTMRRSTSILLWGERVFLTWTDIMNEFFFTKKIIL